MVDPLAPYHQLDLIPHRYSFWALHRRRVGGTVLSMIVQCYKAKDEDVYTYKQRMYGQHSSVFLASKSVMAHASYPPLTLLDMQHEQVSEQDQVARSAHAII